ncbi:MAG: glutathione S-transferase family protein [Alphaproteobacteria bacterium]|nr:MAG: glutathione S-transferase family protein [Alphaproteobacteria bacterium]
MRLHSSDASPFVRKVRVLLIETGQADEVEIVPEQVTPLDLEPGFTANPLTRLPCLERGDGPALYDSRVITRFLDDRAGGGFYPDPPRLWECLTLEATADGMLDSAVLMRYETAMRPEALRFERFLEAQWGKIARALDVLDSRWGAYLAGPLCMGQIALGCALGYLDFRHPGREWRTGRTGLADWYARFAERESMQQTVPRG